MKHRRAGLAVAIAIAAASARVAAAPDLAHYVHLTTSSTIVTAGGTDLHVGSGYYMDDETWTALDEQVRTLQDDRTRLTAENNTLRGIHAGWQPGWITVAGAIAAGIITGLVVERTLH